MARVRGDTLGDADDVLGLPSGELQRPDVAYAGRGQRLRLEAPDFESGHRVAPAVGLHQALAHDRRESEVDLLRRDRPDERRQWVALQHRPDAREAGIRLGYDW